MEIDLITPKEHQKLYAIYQHYPELFLQNNGYEYLNKSSFTTDVQNAYDTVSEILKKYITGFVKFHNFRLSKEKQIQLRFDYLWNASFTGVGYILLDELLIGFQDSTKDPN